MKMLALLVILLFPCFVFGATLEGELKGTPEHKYVFVKVTIDGQVYEHTSVVNAVLEGQALVDYVSNSDNHFKAEIYRAMYRGAPKLTTIAEWDAWIADGHKIEVCNQGGQCHDKVIPKKPFKGKHPKIIGFKAQYQAATTDADRLGVIADFLGLQ